MKVGMVPLLAAVLRSVILYAAVSVYTKKQKWHERGLATDGVSPVSRMPESHGVNETVLWSRGMSGAKCGHYVRNNRFELHFLCQ